jgi:glycosyltransferase involved in cell wall biosynthesis
VARRKVSLKLDPSGAELRRKTPAQQLTVAAVIPAYNEERRIAAVLKALADTRDITEIIVVSDGSTDRTYEVASKMPKVRAVQLPVNRGKGGAMRAGALMTDADVLVFFDADLTGLTSQHVQDLIGPVASGEYTMTTGVLFGARFATDIAQFFSPGITGQRSIRRDVFLQIPDLDRVGYGIELAINYYVWHHDYTCTRIGLRGVSHPMKEEKLGWFRGAASRCVMYWQMLRFRVSYELHGRPPKKLPARPKSCGNAKEAESAKK